MPLHGLNVPLLLITSYFLLCPLSQHTGFMSLMACGNRRHNSDATSLLWPFAPSTHPIASLYLGGTFIAVDFFFILSGFVILPLLWLKAAERHECCRLSRASHREAFSTHEPWTPYRTTSLLFLFSLGSLKLHARRDHCGDDQQFLLRSIPKHERRLYSRTPHFGPDFSDGRSSWSIFFEMVASVAFIGLIRATRRTLMKVCLGSLGFILIFSVLSAIKTQDWRLQMGMGWGTENFLGGFPRVLYGFVCGMLLYQLRSAPSPYPLLNRLQAARPFAAPILYAALVGTMIVPHSVKGLYLFALYNNAGSNSRDPGRQRELRE